MCECPRIRCECMRISPRICGSSRECARISVNLFANVRVSPANLRGPSANVRECARMCANPRMCANAARMCAKVRECVRMRLCTSANVSRMCANAPANVCECSRICRECLRKHAVSADGTGHVSRGFAFGFGTLLGVFVGVLRVFFPNFFCIALSESTVASSQLSVD